jgi:hypothetical protein
MFQGEAAGARDVLDAEQEGDIGVSDRNALAGSTGRRNTGVKSLCWGFKLQGLSWSFV